MLKYEHKFTLMLNSFFKSKLISFFLQSPLLLSLPLPLISFPNKLVSLTLLYHKFWNWKIVRCKPNTYMYYECRFNMEIYNLK